MPRVLYSELQGMSFVFSVLLLLLLRPNRNPSWTLLSPPIVRPEMMIDRISLIQTQFDIFGRPISLIVFLVCIIFWFSHRQSMATN